MSQDEKQDPKQLMSEKESKKPVEAATGNGSQLFFKPSNGGLQGPFVTAMSATSTNNKSPWTLLHSPGNTSAQFTTNANINPSVTTVQGGYFSNVYSGQQSAVTAQVKMSTPGSNGMVATPKSSQDKSAFDLFKTAKQLLDQAKNTSDLITAANLIEKAVKELDFDVTVAIPKCIHYKSAVALSQTPNHMVGQDAKTAFASNETVKNATSAGTRIKTREDKEKEAEDKRKTMNAARDYSRFLALNPVRGITLADGTTVFGAKKQDPDEECCLVCLDTPEEVREKNQCREYLPCAHWLCIDCYINLIDNKVPFCPLCLTPFDDEDIPK